MPETLTEWLSYIEQLHPKSIDMGLARVRKVCDSMQLSLDCVVITVAGTNGKGSTAAMLESIYVESGYQVGCYTSPHFIDYNERLRINQQPVSDADFCRAFARVESARQAESLDLTYFEFGTLAAVYLIQDYQLDVAVLEVGLGGRLDAVNIFDSDCAIVTNIALDHQDYLGDTREAIAFEKSGVYRSDRPAICGDENPPAKLINHARAIQANLLCIQQDFKFEPQQSGFSYTLNEQGVQYQSAISQIGLSGQFQYNNAACAITATRCLRDQLPLKTDAIDKALASLSLTGRFEVLSAGRQRPTIIFDVAHNPHAAIALATQLNDAKLTAKLHTERTIAVFGMLSDKDWSGVIEAVNPVIDDWHIGTIEHPRGASGRQLSEVVRSLSPDTSVTVDATIGDAFEAAVARAQTYVNSHKTVKILVFGSFFTVSDVKLRLQQ